MESNKEGNSRGLRWKKSGKNRQEARNAWKCDFNQNDYSVSSCECIKFTQ